MTFPQALASATFTAGNSKKTAKTSILTPGNHGNKKTKTASLTAGNNKKKTKTSLVVTAMTTDTLFAGNRKKTTKTALVVCTIVDNHKKTTKAITLIAGNSSSKTTKMATRTAGNRNKTTKTVIVLQMLLTLAWALSCASGRRLGDQVRSNTFRANACTRDPLLYFFSNHD
jgi:hypothetical protein